MRIVASVALTLVLAWSGPAFAQPRPAGFPDVIGALKATPGVSASRPRLRREASESSSRGSRAKKALVDWYHGDVHQKAMKTAFPDPGSIASRCRIWPRTADRSSLSSP